MCKSNVTLITNDAQIVSFIWLYVSSMPSYEICFIYLLLIEFLNKYILKLFSLVSVSFIWFNFYIL